MQVILTHTELNVYKLNSEGFYQLVQQRSTCEPSALSTSENGVHPSNGKSGPALSIAIGCKNGYFFAYEVSLEEGQVLKSFSKNLNEPVQRVLAGGKNMPYYLVATADHVEVYNRENYRKELEIPITGSLGEMVYEESKDIVIISDETSIVRVSMSASNNVQIRRTPRLAGSQETAKKEIRRALQNETAYCGNKVV